jgi:hypothetical protein
MLILKFSYYAALNAMGPRKKQKGHEGFGPIFSLRTMLGFLTRGGGGAGAESGRGLRAFTTWGLEADVDAGAGDVEDFIEGGVGEKTELGAGEGCGAGKLREGVDWALEGAAGFGAILCICSTLKRFTFSLMSFLGGGPSEFTPGVLSG